MDFKQYNNLNRPIFPLFYLSYATMQGEYIGRVKGKLSHSSIYYNTIMNYNNRLKMSIATF